ncbi:cbb3-type cytochrome oxidase assembly protein CcoS [uncultured Thiodictyon sp.]|uniref:cbb3-type cytochrome oxidase assembly protein CcoS n=1 Tax=uncultured Thiodictyon sp. TaxID=1846217 RepID=UPI0025F207A8|nr:cbb3-type cytochrome oxidase assembly protein CcoS [uncultured Thiodictyon sp.]
MEVIYALIPGMIILGLAAVAVLFWAARSGQFDDLDGDGRRILMDEDEEEPGRVPDADPPPGSAKPGAPAAAGPTKCCETQSGIR